MDHRIPTQILDASRDNQSRNERSDGDSLGDLKGNKSKSRVDGDHASVEIVRSNVDGLGLGSYPQFEALQEGPADRSEDNLVVIVRRMESDLAAAMFRLDVAAKDKLLAEERVAELKQQLASQAQTLQQAQETRDEQTARINTLEAQLKTLTDERDAAAKEKTAAQQSATELQQQLAAQAETLRQAQKARDEQTARISSLETELKTLTGQRESTIAGLHRLRHLARATGHAS